MIKNWVVIVLTLVSYSPALAGVVFQSGFENGFTGWTHLNKCCSYSQQKNTDLAREGTTSARFELRHTDPLVAAGKRSMACLLGNPGVGEIGGDDEWFALSVYLPAGYGRDSTSRDWGNELIAQWHAVPDPGEPHRSPPLALYIADGDWFFDKRHAAEPVQTSNNGVRKTLWREPYQAGQWVDFVIRARWSYLSDGQLQIWQNGIMIVDDSGPNCYNDQQNLYWCIGIYKWPWNNDQPTDVLQRVIYVDSVRVGDATSSYAEVSPPIPDNMAPGPPMLSLR